MMSITQSVTKSQVVSCSDQLNLEINTRAKANDRLLTGGESPVILDLNSEIIAKCNAAIALLNDINGLLNQCEFSIPK